MKHSLIIISGPGGSGKDTLIAELLKNPDLHLQKLVNHTSRPKRIGEEEGRDYHFVTTAEFENRIARGQMLEYEVMAANGHYYGTDKTGVEKALEISNVICKKMPHGSLLLKQHFLNRAVTIFLDASNEELEHRLLDVSRTGEHELIAKRLQQADNERSLKSQFDHIITNHDGDLAHVIDEATKIIEVVINQ